MQSKQLKETCTRQCQGVITERNRYFTGKYLTKRDFEHEQQYFLSRHQLHNRLLHGMGIVCGLEVEHHPDPNCEKRWVVVRAGIALDCCGRELMLEQDTPLELPLPLVSSADQESQTAKRQPEREVMYTPFLLVLRYDEKEIEHVPAIYSEDNCGSEHYEANRVREVARLDVLSPDEVEASCWKTPSGATDPHWPTWITAHCSQAPAATSTCGRDAADASPPGPAGICLEPECPCHRTVPLAWIDFDPDCVEAGFTIDDSGRRRLPLSEAYLTHIVHINWPHGGYMTLAELEERGGRLEVHFDHEIMLPPPERGAGIGINEETMKVQYQEHTERSQLLQDLPFSEQNRPKLENGSVAVFTIEPSYYVSGGRDTDEIDDATIYITLYCDFILDRYGNPVDGDHLKGQLPSGNGHPGGVFRSWFRIVDDANPEISLSISGPTRARRGENVTLLLTVTNRSTTDLHDITLIADPDSDNEESIGGCDQPLLAGGLSFTCPYDIRIPDDATSPYVVIVQVRSNRGSIRDTGQHVIQLAEVDQTLEVTKCLNRDAPDYPDVLTYDITIKNNGAQDLTEVILTDRYWAKGGTVHFANSEPDNPVRVDETGRRVAWRWGALPGGSEKTITTKMRIDFTEEVATILNCARISARTPNGARISDSDKERITVKQSDRDQT